MLKFYIGQNIYSAKMDSRTNSYLNYGNNANKTKFKKLASN